MKNKDFQVGDTLYYVTRDWFNRYNAMRHTHATWLIEAGANIKAVQTRLGHSDIKTTLNIYAHVTKKMEDDTLDIIKKF